MSTYDMAAMRKQLISKLATNLNKSSKFYRDDYEGICKAVNRKTRKELLESLGRTRAIASVSNAEIVRNCKV